MKQERKKLLLKLLKQYKSESIKQSSNNNYNDQWKQLKKLLMYVDDTDIDHRAIQKWLIGVLTAAFKEGVHFQRDSNKR